MVHDYMQFNMVLSKFKTAAVVVYCSLDDKEKLERIKEAMCQARAQLPLKISATEEGQQVNHDDDVLFIISTMRELMPVTKLAREETQALFVHPQEKQVSLLEEERYLKHLKKVEGKTLDEFMKLALDENAPEFTPLPTDDDMEQNKKETNRIIFSPERFVMPKLNHTFNRNGELEKAEGIV